jgi:hypothetical protein
VSLKPAGTPVEPAVAATDKALETGSIDELVRDITAEPAGRPTPREPAARSPGWFAP